MANNHSTLTSLFTDIADAIREKTGGTESIVADNFPTAIGEIVPQEDLDEELTTQENLIEQISLKLQKKNIEDIAPVLEVQDELIASISTLVENVTSPSETANDVCTLQIIADTLSSLEHIYVTVVNGEGESVFSDYVSNIGVGTSITINNILKNSQIILIAYSNEYIELIQSQNVVAHNSIDPYTYGLAPFVFTIIDDNAIIELSMIDSGGM